MDYTDNYNLVKPAKSQKAWGILVNDNFDKIDNEIKNTNDKIGDVSQLDNGSIVAELESHAASLADIAININNYIFLVKNKESDRKLWDWTDAINAAVQNYKRIYFPKGLYGIYGILIIPDGVKLIGTKEGFTQVPSSFTDNGADRRYSEDDSKFLLYPNDMINPTIQMGRDGVIKGIDIFYPNQLPSFTQSSQLIQYPLTISASHGSGLVNVSFWGAIDFFRGSGERIFAKDVYGYNFGKAIHIKNSADVCYLENIHFNPNIVRPSVEMCNFNAFNPNAIGIYLEEVDGVFINNYHSIFYRTSVKYSGNSGARSFICNNFWLDYTGVAFDIEGDFGMGAIMSNGHIVTGYSDTADYGGLIRLNKATITQITPIFLNNIREITGANPNYQSITPSHAIHFEKNEGFKVLLNNIEIYGVNDYVYNQGYNIIDGSINNGNNFINLKPQKPIKNFLKNTFSFKQSKLTSKPFYWSTLDNEDLTYEYLNNGNLKLTNNTILAEYKGLSQRFNPFKAGAYTAVIKASNFSSNSQLRITTYNSSWSVIKQYSCKFDSRGYAVVNFDLSADGIVDFKINPGTQIGDSVEIQYCLLVQNLKYAWKDYESIQNMDEDYNYYAMSAPTSGTWSKGDRVINSNPTVGQPKSWICTVSGTPGTFVSEGNL